MKGRVECCIGDLTCPFKKIHHCKPSMAKYHNVPPHRKKILYQPLKSYQSFHEPQSESSQSLY